MSFFGQLLRWAKRRTDQIDPEARRLEGTDPSCEKLAADKPQTRRQTAVDADDESRPSHHIPMPRGWH
jgi:hypothetical protein